MSRTRMQIKEPVRVNVTGDGGANRVSVLGRIFFRKRVGIPKWKSIKVDGETDFGYWEIAQVDRWYESGNEPETLREERLRLPFDISE